MKSAVHYISCRRTGHDYTYEQLLKYGLEKKYYLKEGTGVYIKGPVYLFTIGELPRYPDTLTKSKMQSL